VFVAEGFLLLSEWFRWFPKCYAVLFAVACVGAAVFFMLLWFADSLDYRRTFQFSMRSLFLFTVAIAVLCSWLTNELRSAQRQRAVLTEIDKARYGTNFFPVGAYSYPVVQLGWPTYWPRRLLGDDFFVTVDYVFLSGNRVTDAMLENLKGLRELKKLNLQQTQITDAGMQHLNGVTQLQELSIWDSSVTDSGLMYLGGLLRLTGLHLSCTHLSEGRSRR